MKTSWIDVKCQCGFVWNIRAPSLVDILKAHQQQGRIVCLRCGKAALLDIPNHSELHAELYDEDPKSDG